MTVTAQQIAAMIDHTVLKAETTAATLDRFCAEAATHGFASVCVNPYNVAHVAGRLSGTNVKTCAVIGFPLGATATRVKAFEAQVAVEDGAQELDMVLNIGALKDGRDREVADDIAAVVGAGGPTSVVKVILETAVLSDDEIVRACELAVAAGADFVKTSSGFGPGGATSHAVALMHRTVAGRAQVKASTGISDLQTLVAMMDAGATRMGTSKGVTILEEFARTHA